VLPHVRSSVVAPCGGVKQAANSNFVMDDS
jgi:hypothetical protein